MENYDNFFNFNDQGRTPVYQLPSWRMSWCSPA